MKFDMKGWLDANKIKYRASGLNREGWDLYHVDCLFDPNHKDKDSYFAVTPDGFPTYQCSHNSCREKKWRDAREKIISGGGVPPGKFASKVRQGRVTEVLDDRPYVLDATSAYALDREEIEIQFLVKKFLVHGQPALIGGASKTLKTSLALDLAVSLATGTPWLGCGELEVPEITPTLMISGESGRFTVRETVGRIYGAKGLGRPKEGDPLHLAFNLPKLSLMSHLEIIQREIDAKGIKVLILDPAYLSLMSDDDGKSSSVFSMGTILRGLQDVMDMEQTTMILLHHFRKAQRSSRRTFQAPGLEEFSQAGFAEWARQWALLARRNDFSQGTHELYLQLGGSCGQAAEYNVNIHEGVVADENDVRDWTVTVEPVTPPVPQDVKERDDVLAYLRGVGEPRSKNDIALQTRITNSTRITARLEKMLRDGDLIVASVKGHKGCHLYEVNESKFEVDTSCVDNLIFG